MVASVSGYGLGQCKAVSAYPAKATFVLGPLQVDDNSHELLF